MNLTDLARAASKGDRRAWNDLAKILGRRLHPYFRQKIGEGDVSDRVQETLLLIARKLPRFEPRDSEHFIRWVYRLAYFQALEATRQKQRTAVLFEAVEGVNRTPASNVSSRMDRLMRYELVKEEAAELSRIHRRAIENLLDGEDAGKLAEQEGIARTSARTRLNRALEELRVRVEARRQTTTSART